MREKGRGQKGLINNYTTYEILNGLGKGLDLVRL